MPAWGDRFNKLRGKTRLVVCRLFLHLAGEEVAPLLGLLNRKAREAIAAEGDLNVLGEGLVEICQNLQEYEAYWRSAANEGDVFWDEGAAGDYVEELFTDSAQRYLSEPAPSGSTADEPFALPVTENLIVMIAIAAEGEHPDLETDLASYETMSAGLKAIVNLHYQGRLRAVQVHFSPAQFGDRLTDDQLLVNFPELIPF
ncbi:DUF1517 domain-containing protein [Desertifilum sp. FACHB-1129]|uniref:DUF1517 domain-containing protein n=2 Tax=Desertifilum tharense IPPAS B-1220 TaxID=1781255 RepID=A0A1E5QLF2_9CYAN|nr:MULTISPECIES: DUF1517 domain-containing protein [Desertifilum]MDA0209317.1 DUF1517 domain-containing protein [Cyanobacteria bacterium FC1]MBD2314916.1 DUF1517 domain-containing protein [Desertifilum sp. FACHB-1129]MBD2325137.1 DUF1517 domain-containing protein [Desertifilum sp. FACHB-866]MBD2332721.1 DUF1517 domain-containing protein [Desertifilum sp. FACHB-868]OEJ75470.1 hypothetical protein BH720_09500 [Desertifilum tharense IPPAS B-1220]